MVAQSGGVNSRAGAMEEGRCRESEFSGTVGRAGERFGRDSGGREGIHLERMRG